MTESAKTPEVPEELGVPDTTNCVIDALPDAAHNAFQAPSSR